MRRLRVEGPESLAELVDLYKKEINRHVRQRLQALIFIKEGRTAIEVAELLKRHADTIRDYVHQYNQKGLDGLRPRFKGASRRMTPEQEKQFQQRVFAGALPEDGVQVLHGVDFQRILQEEFGLNYTLRAVYVILDRLGCSSLCPRPSHPKGDRVAQAAFKKRGVAANHSCRTNEVPTAAN